MIIACMLEPVKETRVAISPNAVKSYIKAGFSVAIESNAGLKSAFSNSLYQHAGATIVDKKTLLKQCNILLCVNEPKPQDLSGLSKNTLIIAPIDNEAQSPLMTWAQEQEMTLLSMNLIPRISRAQSMDSLSSQANLAGYRAVLEAINLYQRVVPMMMTAAGMIQPAKVLILGAGVAGLQAIATAKRIGAVVYAFDVRRAAKEQVESLGAEFVEVSQDQDAETKGGYAAETSDEYKQKQAELIDEYAQKADIVISTALIPGRKAPILIEKKTVEHMKPGSIIVDLATARGGNCAVSELDKTIRVGEVTVIGESNMPGLVPTTASELYANNLVHLINLIAPSATELKLNPDDEIVQQAVLCHQGNYMPFPNLKEKHNA